MIAVSLGQSDRMNLNQTGKQLRAYALNYATVISAKHARSRQPKGKK